MLASAGGFQVGQLLAEGLLDTGVGGFTGRALGSGMNGPTVRLDHHGMPIHHKRRRRRRALTASDRADIGFIVGLLGPAAGKNFAVTLAARPR